MARQAANDFAVEGLDHETGAGGGQGAAAPATGPVPVGERLRATRDALGIELRDVSETLRIRYDHLLAIEERRYAELPAPVYAIGFIRSYATFLDLDAEQAVRDYKIETTPGARATKRRREPRAAETSDRPRKTRSGRGLWVAAAVIVIVAIGGWELFLASREATIVQEQPTVAPSSQADQQPAPAVVEATPPEPVPTEPVASEPIASEPIASEPIASGPIASGTVPSEAMSPESAGTPATSAPDPGTQPVVPPTVITEPSPDTNSDTSGLQPLADDRLDTPDVGALRTDGSLEYGDGVGRLEDGDTAADSNEAGPAGDDLAGLSGSVDSLVQPGADANAALLPNSDPSTPRPSAGAARVVLHATADSWVQVRDASDSLIMTRVLRAGDSYQVPSRSGLILVTGNAGGLEVTVDGRTIPPLGPRGAVRRNVSLDPESLLARSQAQ